jgi:hypothetical protein
LIIFSTGTCDQASSPKASAVVAAQNATANTVRCRSSVSGSRSKKSA